MIRTTFLTSSALTAALAGLALVGCYKTPDPECALACEFGAAAACPDSYTCRPDGMCKRNDVADNFACPNLPGGIDAAVLDGADIDAASIDGAIIDAPMIDALDAATPIDAIDAAPPVDAFAGLRITTTNPLAFGNVTMNTTATMPVVVTNDGAATTTAITVTVSDITGTGFTLAAAGNTCTGQTLATGANCGFTVEFTPGDTMAHTGTAAVAAGTGGNSSINLTGTGN